MTSPHTRLRPMRLLGSVLVMLLLVGVGMDCTVLPVTPAGEGAFAALEVGRLRETVEFLADPAAGGRMTGTRGNDRAGEYIAERMGGIGLTPVGDNGTFFQSFQMSTVRVAAVDSALSIDGQALRLGTDFNTMAAGADGAFAGPVVFVGYGLAADYYDVDVVGAVVMLLIGSPAEDGWDPRVGIVRKLQAAREYGAVGALVVAPEHVGAVDVLADVYTADRPQADIPAMRLSRLVADRLIGADKSPQSFKPNVIAAGTIATRVGVGRNVIGILPATDGGDDSPQNNPHIIVLAHYDHLSNWGDVRDQDVGWGVRPGADDNATGVAGLLAIAEALAAMETRYCDTIFIATSGEEYGYVGSSHYVANPVKPLADCPVVINLDQISCTPGQSHRAYVIGSVMGSRIGGAVRQANDQVGLPLWPLPVQGIYWADDAVFADAGLETLLFYGGRNKATYHQRSDTPDTVDTQSLHTLTKLVFETIRRLDHAYGAPGK